MVVIVCARGVWVVSEVWMGTGNAVAVVDEGTVLSERGDAPRAQRHTDMCQEVDTSVQARVQP